MRTEGVDGDGSNGAQAATPATAATPAAAAATATGARRKAAAPTDVDRMAPAEVLKVARLYFLAGCFFLPWMWLASFLYLFPATRRRTDLSPAVRN
ncbi:hypothetical protein HK405_000208, partial [Cladochytrium tenue]